MVLNTQTLKLDENYFLGACIIGWHETKLNVPTISSYDKVNVTNEMTDNSVK